MQDRDTYARMGRYSEKYRAMHKRSERADITSDERDRISSRMAGLRRKMTTAVDCLPKTKR